MLNWRFALAVILVAVGARGAAEVRADDAPPTPVPGPIPEQSAELARADALTEQVEALFEAGKILEAVPLARESLAIRERHLASDHPKVALSLNNLAALLVEQEAFGEALPLHERALAIREKVLGKDHLDVSESLFNIACLLQAEGQYREARPLFARALAIQEKEQGGNHPDVALCLNNFALLLEELGELGEARLLHERALAIRERALGKDHPHVATSLANIGMVLRSQGKAGEARPLLERALAIFEKSLGEDHPATATILNNLALLLWDQGALREARPLMEQALAIREKVLGKDHPDVANSLNNLALLLQDQGAPEEARLLHERALGIRERALGKDHPHVATSLSNLGLLLQSQGKTGEARPLLERALAIVEKSLGEDNPDTATILNNLALLLQDQGALGEARLLMERAFAIRERVLGKDHPHVANSLSNLARLLAAQGATGPARLHHERALAITEADIRRQYAGLTGPRRMALLRSVRYRLDNWLSFAPRVKSSGYAEVLRFRGIVARAEAAERAIARHASGEERGLVLALQAAQHLAARLANEVPPKTDARAAWQRRYAEVAAERERLTRELSARSAPLRAGLERLNLTVADVQAQLDKETAHVDLLRVRARYLAWILRASGEVVRIDLGAATAIETACGEWLQSMLRSEEDASGTALRALIWAPVEERLGPAIKRVVICPDTALAAVPFGALPGKEPGRHLLDDYALSYVGQAQDLVPWEVAPTAGAGALLVGGVDYEQAASDTTEPPPSEGASALAVLDRAPRGERFDRLPQTQIEVEDLRRRLGTSQSTLLLGGEATESRFRAAIAGKRFLHVATHGFAREDLLRGLYRREVKDSFLSAAAEQQLGAGHDPMLLSGLALAGANPREGGGTDDGILTALEASYLNLEGIDLVTLSACETARGTAESGEGVIGLVSAFEMAGAKNVVASLWKVDDEATRLLMEEFYERVLRKEKPLRPADALREASLALRDRKDADGKQRFASPRYWAAFVAYGRR